MKQCVDGVTGFLFGVLIFAHISYICFGEGSADAVLDPLALAAAMIQRKGDKLRK